MKSRCLSLLLHAGAVFAMIHLAAWQQVPLFRQEPRPLHTTTKLTWHLPPTANTGGGGGLQQRPVSRGELPRISPRPFVQPTTQRPETMPLLPVEPAIPGAVETNAPALIGLPSGVPGPPSDGFGRGPGIGDYGRDGGVGNERGPGVQGARETGSLTEPVLLYKTEPEFSEDARKARLQGVVVLIAEIDERGRAVNIRVRQPLGLGLDEKAIQAVRQWRFRPGMRNGRPIVRQALIEVYFRLL